nr:uncharacterized protein LOC111417778 [Onthophagus taurus]
MKCFHYRQQVCGNICQAKIMHTQTHQICDENPSGPPNCHNQIIYIPQPQPRCTYLDVWPYVSCNIQSMDNSYNVGPFPQSLGQSYGSYPYGQYPNQFAPYQNFGYNFNQYNPLSYGLENFYSVSRDVDGTNYENLFGNKGVVGTSQENYISETIPIEINQLNNEPVAPELVRVEVKTKPNESV